MRGAKKGGCVNAGMRSGRLGEGREGPRRSGRKEGLLLQRWLVGNPSPLLPPSSFPLKPVPPVDGGVPSARTIGREEGRKEGKWE